MRNLFLVALFIFPILISAQSPSTDKFIRIVGLAEKEVQNNGLRVDFTLTEILGNEYKQIRPRSIEEVRKEFTNNISTIGIDNSRIEQDKLKNISKSNYGKSQSENYFIMVKNDEEALKLSKLKLDGYKVSSVGYTYSDFKTDFYDEMIIDAIKDSRRKAENIAKSLGKEVGEVLNIDESNNASSNDKTYKTLSKNPTVKLSYRVNVTYNLK